MLNLRSCKGEDWWKLLVPSHLLMQCFHRHHSVKGCGQQFRNTLASLAQQILNLEGQQDKPISSIPPHQCKSMQPKSAELRLDAVKSSRGKGSQLNPSYITIKSPRTSNKIKTKSSSKRQQLKRLKTHQPTHMKSNSSRTLANQGVSVCSYLHMTILFHQQLVPSDCNG